MMVVLRREKRVLGKEEDGEIWWSFGTDDDESLPFGGLSQNFSEFVTTS